MGEGKDNFDFDMLFAQCISRNVMEKDNKKIE
jgi:hypothetical protein